MRDFQLQTRQRDQASANRGSKSTYDVNRNLRKITKKSLNPVFQAVSEEDSSVSKNSKEISKDFDDNSFRSKIIRNVGEKLTKRWRWGVVCESDRGGGGDFS
ncbi:hypothetical protein BUALT_Bualt14G0085400 [Buddleja alternifolia]|uniref:Uncharacterized protein n=1 Tax=Buddleja alternifolia TaxID=168488 RepID=A0AAV6WML3_9LAMI|nr:hypothetical protein BUALT_Bualt14G0085400 [Buddleja alternifolia]